MKIIVKNIDNTVSVITPTTEFLTLFDTEQEAMDALKIKDVSGEAIESEIVDDSTIPSDRTFRNAWFKNGVNIDTDMPKAKEIAHTQRRIERDKLFKPLDIKATIPAEAGQAEIDRQVIRDDDALKQIAIDNSNNVTELKTAMAIVI